MTSSTPLMSSPRAAWRTPHTRAGGNVGRGGQLRAEMGWRREAAHAGSFGPQPSLNLWLRGPCLGQGARSESEGKGAAMQQCALPAWPPAHHIRGHQHSKLAGAEAGQCDLRSGGGARQRVYGVVCTGWAGGGGHCS